MTRFVRHDSVGSEGDMEYLDASGLWVPVDGTPSTGDVPTKQSDGTVAWAAAGGSGSGAEVLITETVLGASAATITFSSIAASYRDLRLVLRGRGTTSGNVYCRPRLQMNGDTGSNYDMQRGYWTGAGGAGESATSTTFIDIGLLPSSTGPTNQQGAVDCRILNYRGTVYTKPVLFLSIGSATSGFALNGGGWWKSTSAITSLTLSLDAGNFAADTIASLYGIL